MNTQLENLAAKVLDMRARQQELYRLEKTRRYKLNLDAEMMAELAALSVLGMKYKEFTYNSRDW